jgi:hypothetical protein
VTELLNKTQNVTVTNNFLSNHHEATQIKNSRFQVKTPVMNNRSSFDGKAGRNSITIKNADSVVASTFTETMFTNNSVKKTKENSDYK